MGQQLSLAGAIVLAALSGGCCTTPITAHVECGGLQHVAGDFGYSNGAPFALGAVRRYTPNGHIRPNDRSMTLPNSLSSTPSPDTKQSVEKSIKIDISADVPATVQAEIRSAITDSMTVEIKGDVSRSEIPGYIDILNGDAALKDSVSKALDDPQLKVFLVYSITLAKEVHFSLANAASASASANVLNVGNFKVSVDYKCSDKLDRKKDTPVPMFFKPVWLKKGADGKIVQDDGVTVDLTNAVYVEGWQ